MGCPPFVLAYSPSACAAAGSPYMASAALAATARSGSAVLAQEVAVITPYLAQPGTQFYVDGFETRAGALGWDVNVIDTAGDAAGVDDEIRNRAELAEAEFPVARETRIISNQRIARTREPVEQRRLADIGSADQCDYGKHRTGPGGSGAVLGGLARAARALRRCNRVGSDGAGVALHV